MVEVDVNALEGVLSALEERKAKYQVLPSGKYGGGVSGCVLPHNATSA